MMSLTCIREYDMNTVFYFILGLFCLYQVTFVFHIRSVLPVYWVYLLGFVCQCIKSLLTAVETGSIRSLLPMYWVSFAYVLGLFVRSLLHMYEVSFDSCRGRLFWARCLGAAYALGLF